MKKIDNGTIIRTVLLVIALLNQGLVAFGYSPLPFDDAQLELFISTLLTAAAAIAAWWKNNSFTKPAIKADEYKDKLKKGE